MTGGSASRRDSSLFGKDHRRPAIVVLVLVGIVAFNQITTITVLPAIASTFAGSGSAIAWVVVSYVLGMAITTAAAGPGIDAVGLRTAFRLGVVATSIGTLACAIAPELTWLWSARLVQGIGSGILVAASLAAMGSSFTADLRPRLLAGGALAWALVSVGSPAVSAIAIRAPSGWRGVFVIGLIVTVVTGLIGWNGFSESTDRVRAGRDWKGLVLVSAFTMTSVTGVALRQEPIAAPLFGTAVLSGLLYWAHTARTARPFLQPSHFVRGPLGKTNIAFALAFGVVQGINAYMPFFAHLVLGSSAGVSALAVMPLSLGWAFGAVLASRSVRRFGSRPTALVSYLALIGSFAGGFVLLWGGTFLGALFAVAAVTGLGIGSCEVASQEHLYSIAPPAESGRVSSAHYYLRGLAYSYFAAAVGSLVLGAAPTQAAVIDAYRLAYLGSTAITAVAVAVGFSRGRRAGTRPVAVPG